MKTILNKIILWIVVILVFDMGLNTIFEYLYKKNKNNFIYGHLNYFLEQKNCDTLFLGSSKFLRGIDPNLFGSKTYNLSFEGTDLIFHYGVTKILEQKNKLPNKLLVLNIEPYDFDSNFNFQEQIGRLKFYYFSNQDIKKEINQISTFEWMKYILKSFRFNGVINTLLTEKAFELNERILQRGHIALSAKDQNQMEYFLKNKKTDKNLKFNNNRSIFRLKEIIKLCEKNKIKLQIICMPNYYISNSEKSNSIKVKELLQKHNVSFLNYFQNKVKELENKRFWYNNTHLNELGVKIISEKIKNDLY